MFFLLENWNIIIISHFARFDKIIILKISFFYFNFFLVYKDNLFNNQLYFMLIRLIYGNIEQFFHNKVFKFKTFHVKNFSMKSFFYFFKSYNSLLKLFKFNLNHIFFGCILRYSCLNKPNEKNVNFISNFITLQMPLLIIFIKYVFTFFIYTQMDTFKGEMMCSAEKKHLR